MEHEMILVPRAELLAWAKAWLHDYDPNDGTDCVTPFDGYLLCTPKLESAPVGVNRLVGLMREVIPALRATGVNVTLADDVEKAAALAQQTAAEAQPVAWQFQGRDGIWHGFLDERHRLNTIEDGSWPIRALYAHPPPSAPVKVEAAAADVLHKLRRLALVIREHGTCAPLALDHIGDDLERALAQQPPAEAQTQGGGECCHSWEDYGQMNVVRCNKCEARAVNGYEERPFTAPPSAPVVPYTYASTQATKCAGCGEHEHTPLRIDAMGGYVCLTCIDRKLGSLLGEFGHAPSEPVGVPVDVVREYLDARACYEAATRPPNSHARAPVLKHDDSDARRLREARVALDNAIAIAQQPPAEAQTQGGGEDREPDDGKVICPSCCHQFRAIPVQVQRDMIAAGFEPPFTSPPSAPVGVSPPSSVAWHPIETAPKDNKHPLYLAQFDRDTGELIELDWDAGWEAESESWEMPQVYYIWRSANGRIEEPTHWAYQNASIQQPPAEAVELTVCCGREECGGECGNEWRGMEWVRKDMLPPAEAQPDDPVAADNKKAANRACLAMIAQGYYWNGEAWARAEAQAQGGGECCHSWQDYGQMNVVRCDKCEARAVNGYEDRPFTAPPSAPEAHCTCPSGDGSLRWPCPAHPPEAQPVGSVVWSAGIENTMIEVEWSAGTEPPVGTKLYAATPPRAPVGVEDLSCCGGNDETPKSHCMDCSRYPGQLSQQPAAVDEAIATASDRDLLKTVASATGLTWRKDIEEERAAKNVFGLWITNPDGSLGNTAWNPLHSSSDAFHLAVELGISVCVRGDAAATRRAIVHAALAAQPGGSDNDR